MTINLTDERLCWLAVQGHLDRRVSRVGFFGWLGAVAGRRAGANRLGRDVGREERADRMADFAIAVDEAAQRLSTQDRQVLRASGQVPDWFLPEVERRAEEIRKQR